MNAPRNLDVIYRDLVTTIATLEELRADLQPYAELWTEEAGKRETEPKPKRARSRKAP